MALISRNRLAGDILFIGVGLAGCRIANAIQQLGYECFYINTAIGDFDDLENITMDMTYPIPKGQGCDKDMDLAYSMVENYISDIFNKIDTNYRKYQHIFFIFSVGGGTGSGSTPATAEYFGQQYEGIKSVGIISVLPNKADNAQSAANALKCLDRIANECPHVSTRILLDNEGEDKFAINEHFAQLIDNLLALPEYNVQRSQYLKSADDRETLALLRHPGYIHVSKLSAPTGKLGDNEPFIISPLNYSPMPDLKRCSAIAISIGTEEMINLNPEHLYRYYGRPGADVKAGFNETGETYAYIFGTEMPLYFDDRYNKWLDEFEQESMSVQRTVPTFNTRNRNFLSNQTQPMASVPFGRRTQPQQRGFGFNNQPARTGFGNRGFNSRPVNNDTLSKGENLPPLPTQNPFPN